MALQALPPGFVTAQFLQQAVETVAASVAPIVCRHRSSAPAHRKRWGHIKLRPSTQSTVRDPLAHDRHVSGGRLVP